MTAAGDQHERWIRAFVALYLEVEVGLRPARHIRPLMATDLQAVVGNCGRRGPMPDVLNVRVQSRRGACEAVVLLQEPERVSALAIAVRREEQGWRVAEVRRPDDPPRVAPAEPVAESLAQITWQELSADGSCPAWGIPTGWSQPEVSAPVHGRVPARAA